MKNDELILLENIIDDLDKIFDCDLQITDIYPNLVSTSKILAKTEHFQIIDSTIKSLDKTLQLNLSKEDLRQVALIDTDELRHYIGELLLQNNQL